MLYCTPETVKALRDALASRERTGNSPKRFFPAEVQAILKVFDLAGMAHYNYAYPDKHPLEYSLEEYSQEDIDQGRRNVYLLVGVIESLLDELATLRTENERLWAFVERVAETERDAYEDSEYLAGLVSLATEAVALLASLAGKQEADDGG